ncbi:alpha/beta hydrolase [bacterium 210820-DFI.6.52]|uniref:Alpha/beta fold hydrolase n=1 Tax=Bittarella massiliensis (ex Durand et al. 2017) TaxID=1720313 RepID=A0AAQ1RV39_9FIRM|nr:MULTISPECIES: alpha/beta hydrolase [Eubacteriales]MCB5940889.1 alpha/beta hydrolase [bacterium 210820-DFI.6.52]ERI98542.1 hydrolase, alpha/beta domain protein [Clostridium sp. ATCC 29733]MZL69544.1 alpha/beta fold hydrolase [Bittarella massiliensis (ex Durand et al. 2017)]MZL80461.1 alpha/beta fold hydrolase [Bittarella massiliensis (ex Durand et al. 2017)]SHF77768.1 Pimeloyl-ACP methyl ester carboxylesterase [Bittarella massiliensis (ex Durand et al. 2017)]
MKAEIWGTPVAYEERGEGMPLVAIHGWTGCRLQMTERLEPVFADLPGYRRIYLDLPGMGETPPCARVQNTDEMLAFVRAFIDWVVGEKVPYLVAGHSYGGYLVRGLLAAEDSRAAGGILLCPVANPVHARRVLPPLVPLVEEPAFVQALPQPEREAYGGAIAVQNRRSYAAWQREIDGVKDRFDAGYLDAIVRTGYGYARLPEEGKTVDAPALLFLGRQDDVVGYEEMLELLPHYPRATLALLEHAGHQLAIDQPETFVAMTRCWLKKWESERPQQ